MYNVQHIACKFKHQDMQVMHTLYSKILSENSNSMKGQKHWETCPIFTFRPTENPFSLPVAETLTLKKFSNRM